MSLDELIGAGGAIPPGVNARANTNLFFPPQTLDLIGVQERRFLDHTGLIRHREIGDLMRYSSLAMRGSKGPSPVARTKMMLRIFAGSVASPGIEPAGAASDEFWLIAMACPTPNCTLKIPGATRATGTACGGDCTLLR